MLKKLTALAVGAVMIAGIRAASADTIEPILTSVIHSGSSYTYNYDLHLTGGNGLQDNDAYSSGVILFDFFGYQANSASISFTAGDATASTDWSVTADMTGGAPLQNVNWLAGATTVDGSTFPDSGTAGDLATAENVVVAYTGSGLNVVNSDTVLIQLSVVSANPESALSYATLSTVSRDDQAGTSGDVEGYKTFGPATSPAGSTPLPASVLGGSALLGGLAFIKARGRRKSV
ncbi:MAG TPA: hypothetical protein VGG19_02495 [Tepidisphaeraceae bacterium]